LDVQRAMLNQSAGGALLGQDPVELGLVDEDSTGF
jgi:hypothetical protein